MRLADRIHDLWFSVDSFVVDTVSESMQFPLYDDSNLHVQIVLNCVGVKRVDIVDKEQIGRYDINYLRLSEDRKSLKLACNIPIETIVWLSPDWQLFLQKHLLNGSS